MKKKLGTRFPAVRIKKIMQADEDIGKIAMAVPVLVSKALELFLQDLCDRTYDITVQRGAKTVNSLHLKHCVQSYNVFDFLKEVVSEVPDYGHSDTTAEVKRRKLAANESNESDEESKRNNVHEAYHASSSGRGRGRGRGRGHGRASRAAERELARLEVESASTSIEQTIKQEPNLEGPPTKESPKENKDNNDILAAGTQNSDLTSGCDETSANTAPPPPPPPAAAASTARINDKGDECPGLSEIDRMAIDPIHLAPASSRLDEIEEDYDEEEV